MHIVGLILKLLFKFLVVHFDAGVFLFQFFDMFFKKLQLCIYKAKVVSKCSCALGVAQRADKAA